MAITYEFGYERKMLTINGKNISCFASCPFFAVPFCKTTIKRHEYAVCIIHYSDFGWWNIHIVFGSLNSQNWLRCIGSIPYDKFEYRRTFNIQECPTVAKLPASVKHLRTPDVTP